jgi:hypothetical protein
MDALAVAASPALPSVEPTKSRRRIFFRIGVDFAPGDSGLLPPGTRAGTTPATARLEIPLPDGQLPLLFHSGPRPTHRILVGIRRIVRPVKRAPHVETRLLDHVEIDLM